MVGENEKSLDGSSRKKRPTYGAAEENSIVKIGWMCGDLVPLAGIEPALLAESDFESDASTSSAIGATRRAL
jgi:hypothetical protein